MKICSICKTLKSLEVYSRKSAAPDGRMAECKTCNSDRAKARRKIHPEKIAAWILNWRKRNKEHIKAYDTVNRPRLTRNLQKYRAAKLKAVPKFILDDEWNTLVIDEMYDLASLRVQHTRLRWHVDHIIPLQSKKVCGLHYYGNLRVITAKENQMKSNTVWEGMWNDS